VIEGQVFVACGHFRDIDAAQAGLVVFKDDGKNQTFFDDHELHAFRDLRRSVCMGINSLIAMLMATHSVAAELRVMPVCSLLDQLIGQLKREREKPLRD